MSHYPAPHSMRVAALAGFLVVLAGCWKSPEVKSAEWVAAATKSIAKKDYDRAIVELQNALQATPKSVEANYQMGLALLGRGDPGRAIRHFKLVTELQPNHIEANLRFAEMLTAANQKDLLPLAEQNAAAALKLRPNDPDILYLLGSAEYAQGKTKQAVEHLEMALSTNPAHLKSSVALAMIQRSTNADGVAALRTLQNAVQASAGSAEAILELGRFYFTSGKLKEAEAQFQQVLKSRPDSGDALIELARLQQSSGRNAEAQQTLARLSALPDKSFRAEHALYLFQNGQKDAAIAELERLAVKEPDNAAVRTRLVDLYLETGKLAQADKVLESAIKKDSRDSDALEQQGRLYVLQRKYAQADEVLSRALRARPQFAVAHYTRAQAMRGLNRVNEYRQELRLALDQDPSLVDARVGLSQSLRGAKSLQEAMDLMDETPASVAQAPAILVERAWVLLAMSRFPEAKLNVESALAAKRSPETLLQAGLIAFQEKRYAAARMFLEEVLTGEPRNADALRTIALTLVDEKNLAAAIERIRRQAALAPDSADVQFLLGEWLERSRDPQAAKAAYAAALKADPAFAPALLALAQMDMAQGQWDQARQRLQTVLAREPRNLDAMLAMGILQENTGQQAAAIKTYRAILQIDDSNLVAKNNLVMRLSESPATSDEAITLALQLKEAAPSNPEVDDTIGWAYYNKADYSTAISYFERAAARSKDPRMKRNLEMAQASQAAQQKSNAKKAR